MARDARLTGSLLVFTAPSRACVTYRNVAFGRHKSPEAPVRRCRGVQPGDTAAAERCRARKPVIITYMPLQCIVDTTMCERNDVLADLINRNLSSALRSADRSGKTVLLHAADDCFSLRLSHETPP